MNVFFNYPLPQGYPDYLIGSDLPPLERLKPHVLDALHTKLNPDAFELEHCQPLPHEDPAHQLRVLRQMWAAVQVGDAERAFLLVLEYHNADGYGYHMFDLDFFPDVIFSPQTQTQGCA